jgi:hypothetical protein
MSRYVTVLAVVAVSEGYDLDADQWSGWNEALALVPASAFAVVTDGISAEAVAAGASVDLLDAVTEATGSTAQPRSA